MKTKICHLTSVHSENDDRIFLKECVSLQRNGYDVSLIVAGADDKVGEEVNIYGVQKISNRLKRILFSGKSVLKKTIEIDADLYHFHDPELLSVVIQLKKMGKVVIYDSHEDLPRQILTKSWIPQFMRRFVSTFAEIIENKRVKKLSAIVTATPHIQQRFHKITSAPVVNVNNFPILSEITNFTPWEQKQKAACYVGGLFVERGIFEMVGAVYQTNIKLYLAGKFSPDTLQQEVKKENGWANVDFLGYVDRQKINELLGNSMVGLLLLHPLPSYRDSLPVKMFEYMAAGIPMICSDFELWRNIVE